MLRLGGGEAAQDALTEAPRALRSQSCTYCSTTSPASRLSSSLTPVSSSLLWKRSCRPADHTFHLICHRCAVLLHNSGFLHGH